VSQEVTIYCNVAQYCGDLERKCVPVPLKINSTIKGNCTEFFHRDHLAVLGVIASSLATYCVVL
jgi:hypothetical protein